MGSRRPGADRGQAAVELALALPLVVLMLLAVVQLVVVARDQLAVVHAAREGARAAAVSGAPAGDGAAAARAAIALSPLDVDVSVGGGAVRVSVRHVTVTDIPLVGALLPDVEVRAGATMRLEPSAGASRPDTGG